MTVRPVTISARQQGVVGAALLGIAVVAAWPASFRMPTRWWVVPIVVAIGAALPWCDGRLRATVGDTGRWLAGLGVLGVLYLCVPETDQIEAVVVLVVALAVIERTLGAPLLWPVAMTAVAWAGLYGATGRQSALVGTVVALAVPLVAAAVVALVDRPQVRIWPWAVLLLSFAWAGSVARTGALSPSIGPAVLAAMGFGAALAAALAAVARLTRRQPPVVVAPER